MAVQWVEAPVHLPRKCALTGNSADDAGPYLETGFRYFDPDPNAAATGELRLNTLYLSREWLAYALVQPGAPFVVLDNADYARLLANAKAQDTEIAALRERVNELEAGAPVTVDRDSLRLIIDGMEQTTTAPASMPSTDPDHHESEVSKPKTRKKAAA